jgi:hypothetical protein
MIKFFEDKTLNHFNDGKQFWKFYNTFIKTKKSRDSISLSSILDSESQ